MNGALCHLCAHSGSTPFSPTVAQLKVAIIIKKIIIFILAPQYAQIILCEHVHILELRKSFKFGAAVATQQVYRKHR